MSEQCTHNCETCGANCSSRKKESFLEPTNEFSNVKKVIAVVSGKGGVGKSMMTSLLAAKANRDGKKTAILDADITGPSIPKAFGLTQKATGSEGMLFPVTSKGGIKAMSVNLVLENDTQPVIWRGPVLAGVVKQFWGETVWDEVDYMFVDMPPGTGDVPLTVFQSIPVSGIVIVTSPQELVSMIVAKAVNMAKMMNIPILALVENMAYYECPHCGEKLHIYGDSKVAETAKEFGIDCYASLPIDTELAKACDEGKIEQIERDYLNNVVEKIYSL